MKEIPNNAIKIQEGLYGVVKNFNNITTYNLYAQKGYRFYIIEDDIDEKIIDIPFKIEKIYYQFMNSAYCTIEQINQAVACVLIEE